MAIIYLSRGRCGLSRCITYYLLMIVVNDFIVIITAVILNRIGGIYFRDSVLSTTPGCMVSTMLIYATRDGSVWLTVAFTIDRFIAISCQRLKSRYCTEKTAWLVIGSVTVMSCIKNVAFCFAYKPLYTLDGTPWFCDIKSAYYTSPVWQAYDWMDHILTPVLPFFLILLLNALTIRHIRTASRARRRLRGIDNCADHESANRRRSVVLLFTISMSFLFLWVTYVAHFLYVRITDKGYFTGLDFKNPDFIFQEVTNMFQLLSSCNNVFIYAVSQTKFQGELKTLLMCHYTTLTGCLRC
ncbi:probable G-protein coupled receptor 139 [Hemiscyllium ocellatum]|uniref:probable G-protein coupled receptor 139 n=1 Tax=Hemiscyllium ocellatum TaxID=170820 RepID=UPI0029669A7E|nr:probable G-protein coupled receptor 139 [Hemiscyllium ocellatum]